MTADWPIKMGYIDKQGKTVIMVTHDPAISARAYRQIKMEGGQIVSDIRRKDVGAVS